MARNNLGDNSQQNSQILQSPEVNVDVLLAEELMDHLTEDNVTSGNSYHYLMGIFEDDTNETKTLDDAWLTSC